MGLEARESTLRVLPGLEFSAFLERIEARLMSYLRYTCGNFTDAEDLFQDVCLAAHREWKSVRVLEKPEGWMFKVAHNMAANRFKRRDTERRVLQLHEAEAQVHSPHGREETERAVSDALATLPEDQRQAVCQKIWGECSWVEIAQNLGVSEDTAARLFARGLKAIAPRLAALV
jgi:RNA polymerase sigma-70 factor (ECF subfamily)